MKSIFFIGMLFLTTSFAFAQIDKQEKSNTTIVASQSVRKQVSNTTITLGLNLISDDCNVKYVPFIGGNINFKTPFFITAEHRFKSDFSTSLSLTTNQLEAKTSDKFYKSVDVNEQYYFNRYLFNSEKIETYIGLGIGRYFFENKGNNTFNGSVAARYWFSNHYGVSTQLIGKFALPPLNLDLNNLYQLNIGLVWRK